MTDKEAKRNLLHAIRWNDMPKKEALEVAVKAIDREPCDDAISRQAVCKIIGDIRDCIRVNGYWAFLERLKKLPSVNPQNCDKCEVGNPCLYCRHEFEPQESEEQE